MKIIRIESKIVLRISDLSKISESNLVKRIEDLIKKWNYAELDNLLESDFPSELINLNTQKEIEELNPFDGTTMLSAQERDFKVLTTTPTRRVSAWAFFAITSRSVPVLVFACR